nr:methyltransferase domain-containing protein [Nitrosomonas eutropha]
MIVSNCVVNLSPDKDAVLRGVQYLLKDGGEFYFSDVYADRRVPAAVRDDCTGDEAYPV